MSHQHAHGVHGDSDHDHEEALTELLDLDGEVLRDLLSELTAWIAAATTPPVARIVDLGSGTGTGTFALLRQFPGAHVTAVDLDQDRLTRLTHRARTLNVGDQVGVRAANLGQPWPDLGPADLVWASMSLHHLPDPGRALTELFGLLRPGGSLAVVETTALESFPRFLTLDDGLEDRLHTLLAALQAEQVPELGADWGPRLTAAGFTIAAEQDFAIALEPPLPARAGRYAQLILDRLRTGLGDRLDPADQKALALLASDDGPGSVRNNAGLTVRATRRAWLGRRPV